MEKSKKLFACFSDVRALVAMSLFIALSIVFGKFLAFNPTPTIRISLENLPIIVAACAYGPVAGATVGVIADLIGCVYAGYAINPIITLGALTIGLVAGMASYIPAGKLLRSFSIVVLAHFTGSVTIKTIGLSVFYSTPFWITFGSRCIVYAITAFIEGILLYILISQNIIQKFGGRIRK